ncbi:MAG: BON domain-containing protein [Chloroflexota bacterium]
MKTDNDLKRDVLAELAYEPSIKADDIGVSVLEGVITLTGHVSTYSEKSAAERAVRRVVGVRAVAEELVVNLLSSHQRNDSDIAQSAATALDLNISVPPQTVKMIVENGWITLSGDVDWNYQREAAHDAVRQLPGVKGVTNLMEVNPLPSPVISPVEVRSKIETALKRSMMSDIEGITVEANNGKVTLHGKVHSLKEYDDAGLAAWSALGVTTVENDLQVQY